MKLSQNWNEVNIGQYIELSRLKPSDDAIEYQISVIAVLSGWSYGDVSKLPIHVLKGLIEKTAFISTLPSGKPQNDIIISGNNYHVNYDITKLSAGEYIDLKTWTKTSELAQENLHNILSLFIKPVKKRFFRWVYIDETMEQRQAKANLFLKEVSVSTAYPMAVFFCNLLNNLTSGIQEFTLKRTKEKLSSLRQSIMSQHSKSIGAGL